MSSIDAQIRELEGKLNAIKSIDVPRASSSALNKVSAKIKTRVVRGTAKETKVSAKHVRKRVYIRKSKVKTQRAKVKVYIRDISAISLLNNPKLGPTKRKVAGKKLTNAFIADGSRGKGRYKRGSGFQKTSLKNKQVLRRATDSRYPLEAVGVNIRKAATRITKKVTQRVMKEEFQILYARDLNFRLKKYAI